MKLRTKLLIYTCIQVVLAGLLVLALAIASQKVGQANSTEERANKIVDVVSQIRFVSFENLLYHDERSYKQWQSRHRDLQDILLPPATALAQEVEHLAEIKRLSSDVEPLFERLIASYSETAPTTTQLQQHLATQLLIKQQAQISEALELASFARSQSVDIRRQSELLVGAVIVTFLVFAVFNYWFINRTVSRSLQVLQKGAKEIAAGNFAYRITPPNSRDEFGAVAKAFNTMAVSVGELDRAKSEFILLASHQLRTPLTAIKWYAKALIEALGMKDTKLQKKYGKQIHASNERMIHLVNMLLEAAKIDAGDLRPHVAAVELDSVLQQALDDVAAEIHRHKVRVGIVKHLGSRIPRVMIDPAWLRVIFQNIVSNAVRYSRPGQSITVTVKDEGDHALVIVADKGYGIPVEQQHKIFTKLFRADNAVKAVGEGSGLGLYITKAMVEKAGGDIWFESKEDKRTTFFVRLPLVMGDAVPTKNVRRTRSGAPRLKTGDAD